MAYCATLHYMNRKKVVAFLFLVFFACCSTLALAALPSFGDKPQVAQIYTSVNSSTDDISLQMLGKLVGSVGNYLSVTGSNAALMSSIFAQLNMGIMIFAGSVIAFLTAFTVINSAHSGETVFKRLTGWTLPRIAGGFSLLVPVKGGYSLAQIMVITVVIHGVELGNMLWETALDFMVEHTSTFSATYFIGVQKQKGMSDAYLESIKLKKLIGTSPSDKSSGMLPSNSFMANIWSAASCIAAIRKNLQEELSNAQDQSVATPGYACGQDTYSVINTIHFGQECVGTAGGSTTGTITKDYPYICFGSTYQTSCQGIDQLSVGNVPYQIGECGYFKLTLPPATMELYPDIKDGAQNPKLGGIYSAVQVAVKKLYTSTESIVENQLTWKSSGGSESKNLTQGAYYCPEKGESDFFYTQCNNWNATGNTSNAAWARLIQKDGSGCSALSGTQANLFGNLYQYYCQMMALNDQYPSLTSMVASMVGKRKNPIKAGDALKDKINASKKTGWASAGRWFEILAGDTSEALYVYKNWITFPVKTTIVAGIPQSNKSTFYSADINDKLTSPKGYNILFSEQLVSSTVLDRLMASMSQVIDRELELTTVRQPQYHAHPIYDRLTSYLLYYLIDPKQLEGESRSKSLKYIASSYALTSASLSGFEKFLGSDIDAPTQNLSLLIAKTLTYITGLALSKRFTYSVGDKKYLDVDIQNCYAALTTMRAGGSDTVCNTDFLNNPYSKTGYNPMGCFEVAMGTKCIPGTAFSDNDNINQGFGFMGLAAAFVMKKPLPNPYVSLVRMGNGLIHSSATYWMDTINAIYSSAKSIISKYAAFAAIASILQAAAQGMGAKGAVIAGSMGAAMGFFVEFMVTIFYKFDLFFLTYFSSVGDIIAAPIYATGIMLGVYLPFVPQLIFIFTLIGWLVAVIEALVAAPLIAIGVTHPDGADLLSKAEQAVMLLFGVFIRPAAVIIGFIIATELSYVGILLFNLGYGHMMSYYVTMFGIVNNFQIIQNICITVLVFLYAYAVIAIWNQCMGLTYLIPDQVLKWIGGSGGDMDMTKQFMSEVKAGAAKGKMGGGGTTPGGAPGIKAQKTGSQRVSQRKKSLHKAKAAKDKRGAAKKS
jgi:conjugal transfer/type IV secretion protein DotA/TraY